MKKDKTQRYHMTSCRDKRSIVRALNNFSNQYDFIYCGKNEVNLAIESFELNYGNKYDDFAFGLTSGNLSEKERNDIQHKLINNKNIIFSNDEAKIDLCNTQLILEAIDNLISINRQEHLKDELKSVVESRDMNGVNYFFHNEDIALRSINKALNTGEEEEYSDTFIKKLFSQIKNRVKFRRSGVYATNDSASKVVSQTRIQSLPTSLFDIISTQIDFLITHLSILSLETKEDVKQARMVYEHDSKHSEFDIAHTDFDKNSSFFHPIDEEEYNDPEAKESTKHNNMTGQMSLKATHSLFNEEDWAKYHEYDEYEIIFDELVEIINNLIPYISQEKIFLSKIYETLSTEEIEEFEYYNSHKSTPSKNDIQINRIHLYKILYENNKKQTLRKKISLLKNYFLCEDIISILKRYHKDLDTYGFVFSEEEFLKAFDTQKQLFSWYKCKSLQQYETKFDEIGVDGLLLKWFDVLDMEKAYWFDASMYPCYNHLLPKTFDVASENSPKNLISDDELSLWEEKKAREFAKAHPPIPF